MRYTNLTLGLKAELLAKLRSNLATTLANIEYREERIRKQESKLFLLHETEQHIREQIAELKRA